MIYVVVDLFELRRMKLCFCPAVKETLILLWGL